MSMFSRIFGSTPPVTEDFEGSVSSHAQPTDSTITTPDPTPFMSYVQDAIINGPAHTEESFDEESEEEWSFFGDGADDTDDYTYEEVESLEEEEEEEEEAPEAVAEDVIDASVEIEEDSFALAPTSPFPAPVAEDAPPPNLFQASSTEQRDDVQVERIVDGLFDRMRVVWGPQQEATEPKLRQQPKKPASKPQTQQRYDLAESKAEMRKIIRHEVPQALKGELVAVIRKEMLSAVRGEIARVVREEFATLNQLFAKNLERLHALETRLAKIEGAVGKELKLSFPKGMVKIDAPVTVPEREVKVAAPVNVQPPSVTFDEGAISVHFNKTGGGKKEVRFERDPHDNCVKSAEIIDVGGK